MEKVYLLKVESFNYQNRLACDPSFEVISFDEESLKYHLKNWYSFTDQMLKDALYAFSNMNSYIIGHKDNKRETWFTLDEKEVL